MRRPWHARLAPLLALAGLAPAPRDEPDPQVGRSYRVPYRLTETNHFLIRARINGNGPFNLIVDTGAPALFLSSEAAERAGLDPDLDDYFVRLDRVEFEGGAALVDVQARVEDLFQLVGMNALGLPGARIDGMLGFNALARYRITIDPTDDRMTWTRLDHEPPEMVVPRGARVVPPAEVQAMSLLGGVAQLAAVFVGKQPEDQLIPRGFLGLELAEAGDNAVTVARVLPGTPAEGLDLAMGDRLVRVLGRRIESLEDVRLAVSDVEAGDRVTLRVLPPGADDDAEPRELSLTAGEGL